MARYEAPVGEGASALSDTFCHLDARLAQLGDSSASNLGEGISAAHDNVSNSRCNHEVSARRSLAEV
jgi:hypothetical protein